jgi:hypothetical protein
MEVVITSCDNFFPLELKGAQMLIPSFLNAIAFIFSCGKGKKALTGTMLPFSTLRASCIKILGYIVGLPNVFADVKFAEPAKSMKEVRLEEEIVLDISVVILYQPEASGWYNITTEISNTICVFLEDFDMTKGR